jgi:hypothetical protein
MEKGVVKFLVFNGEDFGYWKNQTHNINFYMGINDKKRKSHEDYVELRILYFIRVLGAPYYQGGYIG